MSDVSVEETVNRYRKAKRIAAGLRPMLDAGLFKIVPEMYNVAGHESLEVRQAIGRFLDEKPPSEATWGLVLAMLAE